MSVFESNSSILSQLLARDRLLRSGRAWLFTGPSRLCKFLFAAITSYYIVHSCDDPQKDIGEALNKEKYKDWIKYGDSIMKGQVQGVKYIRGDVNKQIDIEQIRSIENFVSISASSETGKQVVIIDGANFMSEATQNALLKTLEEYLDKVYFILIAEREHDILFTMLSRCIIIPFLPFTAKDIASMLIHMGKSLGKNQAINQAITKSGSLDSALFLYHGLYESPELWQEHLNAWIKVLESGKVAIDLSKVTATSNMQFVHTYFFTWQLRRIFNYISNIKIDNMGLCDHEQHLYEISLHYEKQSWVTATNKVYRLIKGHTGVRITPETELQLLFNELMSGLEIVDRKVQA